MWRKRGISTSIVLLAAGVFACPASGQADLSASQPAPPPRPPDAELSQREHGGWRDRAQRHRQMVERMFPARLGQRLFEPLPEDRGPLEPGEEETLLVFVREHMPRMYSKALEDLRRRDPERFRQRLAQEAPRLRRLQRIYEQTPAIGTLIRRHAQLMFEIGRLRRTLAEHAADSALYASARQELRERVAESVGLEIDALRAFTDVAEQQRDARVAAWADQILGDESDPAALPARIRELVATYREATDDVARGTARAQLEGLVLRQVDLELAGLRERIALMEEKRAAEVDLRMERLEQDAQRHAAERPRPPRRPRPERD